MDRKSGRFKIIEQFIADGMTYMFGNPGTVEQGFLDALSALSGDEIYPDLTRINCLDDRGWVCSGHAKANLGTNTQHTGSGEYHWRHVSGHARTRAAGGDWRRRRPKVYAHGGADVWRLGDFCQTGHQMVHHGYGFQFAVADFAPCHQNCCYAADGAGICLLTSGRPGQAGRSKPSSQPSSHPPGSYRMTVLLGKRQPCWRMPKSP